MRNTITDVFFDLDHTLWDFERNSALTFHKIFGMQQLQIDLPAFIKIYEPINRAYWEQYRKNEINQEELRFGRLQDSFDQMDYSVSKSFISMLSDEYIKYLPTFNHLYDGTIALLDYLQPHYDLHIITNGFTTIQEQKLNNSSIRHYFKTVTDSENAGVKKPNSYIFEYALKQAKTTTKKSVMIGDCIEADIQGALDAGLDAIYFNEYNIKVAKEIKQINHLLELKKYL